MKKYVSRISKKQKSEVREPPPAGAYSAMHAFLAQRITDENIQNLEHLI